MGVVRPSEGTGSVAQRDLSTQSPKIRAMVGYVAEHSIFLEHLLPTDWNEWDGGYSLCGMLSDTKRPCNDFTSPETN